MSDPDETDETDETGDIDTGEPVAELSLLDEEAPPTLLARVRHSIGRRRFANDVVGFAWSAPITVAVEFLSMIFGLFRSPTREENPHDR